MADPILDFQSAPINPGGMPTADTAKDSKLAKSNVPFADEGVTLSAAHDALDGEELATEEEQATLRKVSAPMP
jgi:hypothetical protein